jgi:hypothetical protein
MSVHPLTHTDAVRERTVRAGLRAMTDREAFARYRDAAWDRLASRVRPVLSDRRGDELAARRAPRTPASPTQEGGLCA